MGVYKVIQDIEAEDKLLGPLSLKQFIFAIIAVLFYYLSFLVVAKHVPFLLVLFLPPALFATFFAWPWSVDQPTEVWALAKIRFFFKPRRRIWDQSGQKDLVSITAPKKVAEPMRSNGLSQREVNSRLGALASTIDSRGWAIKNAAINLSTQQPIVGDGTDRLLGPNNFAQEVPNYDIQASDDILDEQNNPIAQQFDQMITAATQAHRQQLVQMMNQPSGMSLPAPVSGSPAASLPNPQSAPADQGNASRHWFLSKPGSFGKRRKDANQPTVDLAQSFPVPAPSAPMQLPAVNNQVAGATALQAGIPTADEEALGRQLKAEHEQAPDYAGRMKTIQPLGQGTPTDDQFAEPPVMPAMPVPQTNPALVELSRNNDLNVATLARQASKKDEIHHDFGDSEVVISLH